MPRIVLALLLFFGGPAAIAHVSERGIVLLLPTDAYILSGVLVVAATVALMILVPAKAIRAMFEMDADTTPQPPGRSSTALGIAAFAVFAALVALGFFGPRDPYANLLPLMTFTVWWILTPLVVVVFARFWEMFNPWYGPVALVFGDKARVMLPANIGVWPALVFYILFATYALTDIAPDDPARLAKLAGGYWAFTFAMCGLFGRAWLRVGEGLTVFFDLIAKLSLFRRRALQMPGRGIVISETVPVAAAIFAVSALAIGSFDGLNETFWWMGKLGINPLEFPGRSAVIWPNRLGLIAAILALNLIVALTVWLGLLLIRQPDRFRRLYPQLALTILPIALGYHLAHYLTSALVGLQYTWVALSDPLKSGANLFGGGDYYVTTGFFNSYDTVRKIWMVQGSAIVIGHVLAVILAHAIALKELGDHRRAILSQIPLALFMVLYTFFGLWLLASPTAL